MRPRPVRPDHPRYKVHFRPSAVRKCTTSPMALSLNFCRRRWPLKVSRKLWSAGRVVNTYVSVGRGVVRKKNPYKCAWAIVEGGKSGHPWSLCCIAKPNSHQTGGQHANICPGRVLSHPISSPFLSSLTIPAHSLHILWEPPIHIKRRPLPSTPACEPGWETN